MHKLIFLLGAALAAAACNSSEDDTPKEIGQFLDDFHGSLAGTFQGLQNLPGIPLQVAHSRIHLG